MTHDKPHSTRGTTDRPPSLLPFDPADLVAMRVLPAEYARMVGVSKQTVSIWIKDGKITLGPDGRVDPYKASREVIERTDPARMRARVFKYATASLGDLRQRVAELTTQLERERATRQPSAEDHAAKALHRFMRALLERFDQAAQAKAEGTLEAWLDELVAVEVYGFDLDAYRAEADAEECPAVPADGAL